MSKLANAAAVAMLLLFSAAYHSHNNFAKYKAVEAYEIRPGVLMMPSYSSDGQVCQIGLEKLHYSSGNIRLDSSLSRKEIDQIFDELVPADVRGPRSKDFPRPVMSEAGGVLVTAVVYQNVTIQIYGSVADEKNASIVDEVVATLKWRNRNCQ